MRENTTQKHKSIEVIMGLILTTGMIIASILVIIGGAIYLFQNGMHNMQSELFQTATYDTNISAILRGAMTFSSVGIIELGLLVLIGTQLVRVAMLVWYYCITQDFWFASISAFILLTLVYSLFWRT